MKTKEIKCKNCGNEISVKAAVCPNCGVKNKKPVYKRAWFIVLVVIVIIAAISSAGNDPINNQADNSDKAASENQVVEETKEYTEYEVAELVSDLEKNALNAETKYNGKYVKISGKLSNIDSDGKYISLEPGNGTFTLMGVQCYIQNDEQKQRVAQMSKGDAVTVKGKIKDIGEVLGYQLDIDSIE